MTKHQPVKPAQSTKPIIALNMPDVEEPLNDRQNHYLDICQDKLGFVPNVLKAYSWHSTKFEAFTQMYNDLLLGPSGLSKLEREMIAVVVSAANNCYYCLTAHGAAVRKLSGNPKLGEQLVMNYRTAELQPKIRAALDFAYTLTINPIEIDEPDRQKLRDAGWSDRDIWDITAVAAFFNMSNRISAATDKQPNDEYHAMNR